MHTTTGRTPQARTSDAFNHVGRRRRARPIASAVHIADGGAGVSAVVHQTAERARERRHAPSHLGTATSRNVNGMMRRAHCTNHAYTGNSRLRYARSPTRQKQERRPQNHVANSSEQPKRGRDVSTPGGGWGTRTCVCIPWPHQLEHDDVDVASTNSPHAVAAPPHDCVVDGLLTPAVTQSLSATTTPVALTHHTVRDCRGELQRRVPAAHTDQSPVTQACEGSAHTREGHQVTHTKSRSEQRQQDRRLYGARQSTMAS